MTFSGFYGTNITVDEYAEAIYLGLQVNIQIQNCTFSVTDNANI